MPHGLILIYKMHIRRRYEGKLENLYFCSDSVTKRRIGQQQNLVPPKSVLFG